jgi:hypothetical protein
MLIAVDFDETIAREDPSTSELSLLSGAKEGLESLRRAGHTLILYSARSNPCLWEDWRMNPLWEKGVAPLDQAAWFAGAKAHRERRCAMIRFVRHALPGVFSLVYEGGGKPVGVDLFIDDRSVRTTGAFGIDWSEIANVWGEVGYEQEAAHP